MANTNDIRPGKKIVAIDFSALVPEGKFLRSVLTLAGGTTSAQLLTVLAAPLLTRLYTPEEFGLLAIYASILALIAVVATFRYEIAIPLPDNDQFAANIVGLSFLILLAITFLSAIAVAGLGDSLAMKLNVPSFSNYIWLLPVGVFLGGIYNIFNYWAVRRKQYSSIANTVISQSVATLGIQLLGSMFGAIALIAGVIVGQGIASFRLAKQALKQPQFRKLSVTEMKRASVRYKKFPIFSSAAGLINSVGYQSVPLIIAYLVGPAAAGVYALASRVVTMPGALIGAAIGNVFLSDAPEQHRLHRLGTLVESVHEKLSILAAPPAIFLMFFGPEVFAFVFGENWRMAGVFAQWLSLPLYAAFITSPLSMIFAIVEQQKLGLYMQAVLMLARLLPLIFGTLSGGLEFGIACFAVGSFFGYMAYALVAFGEAQVAISRIIYRMAIDWLLALLCIGPLALVFQLNESVTVLTLVACMSALLLYFYLRRMNKSVEQQ